MKIFPLFLSLFLLPFLPGKSFEASFLCEEKSKGLASKIQWKLTEKEGKIFAEGNGDSSLRTIEYTTDFTTQKFLSTRGNEHYEITYTPRTLIIKGNRGETKKYFLRRPWLQEFLFALRPFLESKAKSYEFCLVSPKDFALHTLIAKKERKETLNLHQKKYFAEKVFITLPGFKSIFWKAEVWYDAVTYDFLFYRSNEGPGTPMTEVSLVEKEK